MGNEHSKDKDPTKVKQHNCRIEVLLVVGCTLKTLFVASCAKNLSPRDLSHFHMYSGIKSQCFSGKWSSCRLTFMNCGALNTWFSFFFYRMKMFLKSMKKEKLTASRWASHLMDCRWMVSFYFILFLFKCSLWDNDRCHYKDEQTNVPHLRFTVLFLNMVRTVFFLLILLHTLVTNRISWSSHAPGLVLWTHIILCKHSVCLAI